MSNSSLTAWKPGVSSAEIFQNSLLRETRNSEPNVLHANFKIYPSCSCETRFVPKNDDSCRWFHVKGFKPNHARPRNGCDEPFELREADTECAQFKDPPEVRFR